MPDSYNDLIKGAPAAFSIDQDSQQHKNITSVITLWVRANGLTLESAVGDEFGKNFDDRIKEFSRSQAENCIAKSTIQSRNSWLRMVRKNHQKQSRPPLPNTFGDRLNHLISEAGYSLNKFAVHHLKGKRHPSIIYDWIKGEKPKCSILVAEIEEILQAPPGTLTDFLPTRKSANSTHSNKFRERVKNLQRPFHVHTKKTDEEVNAFTKFKTKPILPSGMNRNRKWSTNTNGICYSAVIFRQLCGSFQGFCCLPIDEPDPQWQGLGLSKETLGLHLFAEIDYCERYIEFLYLRGGSVYHEGITAFIKSMTSILRADTGYLWQKKDFAIQAGLSVADWQAKCVLTRNRLLKIKEDIEVERKERGREGTYSRDPKLVVAAITNLSNPLRRMLAGLQAMKDDLLCYESKSISQAIFARDVCLYGLLLANPLRVNMFEKMCLNKNLIRDEVGAWWIEFNKQDFKNRDALAEDYKTRVSPHIWSLLDDYITYYRPILLGEKETNNVFITNAGDRLTGYYLSDRVFELSTIYFPETPGFRAHAMRHIVATGIIKKDRKQGFYKASRALHDKQETVDKNYAHLKTSEEFELYNDLLESCIDDLKGAA